MKVEGVDFNLPRLVGSDLSTRRTLQRHRTLIPQLILYCNTLCLIQDHLLML